jgi:ParB family chromosome partitioning protein
MEIILLPASKLRRRLGARKVSEGKLPGLVDSIRELGIINPLRVRPISVYENGRPGEGWEVTAGSHRFEAASRLNMTELPCIVVQDSDLHAELAMIDENLCRAELTPAEAALQTARRKEIYEILHPETKRGGNAGPDGKFCRTDEDTFTTSTHKATGRAERTVRLDAARGEALGDDLDAIAGTSLDKGVELDALAKLPDPERKQIIQRAVAGEDVSARSAKVDSDVKVRAAREVASIMSEYVPSEWWDALKANLYAAGAANIANELTNITGQSIMDRRYGS